MTFIQHPQAKNGSSKVHCGSKHETERNVFKVQEVTYFSSDEPQKR